MAVLDGCPNIKVHVVSNGTSLKEYDDDDEIQAPNTITKYVEVVSGAEFQIHHEILTPWPKHAIRFGCFLDEQSIAGTIIRKRHYRGTSHLFVKDGASSYSQGQWSFQKFRFAELSVCKLSVAFIRG